MRYGKYRFSCILKSEAMLPPYKGSTFRGVFGTALKQVVCALKRQDCETCLLRKKCIYSLTFEVPPFDFPEGARKRIVSPPHPYVIEPDLDTKRIYKEHESFDFSLILFGESNDWLPYFIYAIEQIGKIGIGKKINGKRPGFELATVRAEDGRTIYARQEQKIAEGEFFRFLQLDDFFREGDGAITRLELILETPFRLKFDNKLESRLPFHVLIRAALRRISSLFGPYGTGEPSLDYRGLATRAEQVRVSLDEIEWTDWRRYSNKQDQAMFMGGISGTIGYSGALAEFLPLLRIAELVHLGKQTTFGLGKLRITKEDT
ncbi:MAG: CRISPR system precrRNA processing endoribonuclease RAMP protein Cas6 [Syntrophales bacterium]|jgi:hypothetical protein|nr:CRISPR system precrRNA processing endoribonuclease RAMP protein Cas6 [Syntrophales bacterium]